METFRLLYELLTSSERRQAGYLVLLTLVATILETLGVGLVIPLLTLVSQGTWPNVARFSVLSQTQLISAAMLGLVLFFTLKTAFMIYLSWCQPNFSFSVGCRLSQDLFRGYLRQPYIFHLQRNSAQLIHYITGEVGGVVHNGLLSVVTLFSEVFVFFGIGILMMAVEPVGTLVVMFVLGVVVTIYYSKTHQLILDFGKERHHAEGMRIQWLQQGLGGAKDVKLLGREEDFLNQYFIYNTRNSEVQKKQTLINNIPRLWLEWLAVLALVVLVLSMLSQGKPISQLIPVLGLFAAAAFRFMPSVNRIVSCIQNVRFSMPAIHCVYEEMMLCKNVQSLDSTPIKLNFLKTLEITNLGYAYPNTNQMVLKEVCLNIARGSSIGFVGTSGAGKSTLIDLILGLLTPIQGRILVDGQDIQHRLRTWQNLMGYVPQSIYLTDDTLRRNIAFGLSEYQIDDQAVKKALQAAQLEEFVEGLSVGWDTLVGERGIRLSGGQRQRIGIARALYHQPEILVLDEATSSLDTETERYVMESVKALKGNKTILIVAHRLSTVAHCDRIYRLEKGRLVENNYVTQAEAYA